MEKEDIFFIKRMGELSEIADRQYRPVFTEFLTLYQNSMVLSHMDKLAPVSTQSWGGYEEAERRLLCFFPMDFQLNKMDFPIDCIHIYPKNEKFSDHLSHRDFLGAVLNLGIDRNRTGDIVLKENDAWLFCDSKIAEFIEQHLERIKRTVVICERMRLEQVPVKTFQPHVQKIKGFVAAIRLDSLIALAFHASRSRMVEYIRSEKVFINGKSVSENSARIKEGDLISVRGMGKFRYIGIEGESKKGRLAICIEKYISDVR